MTFGLRFREARTSQHLSQEAVGERLGVSKATVSSWELDKKLPECERLPAIRTALSCSLDWLFGDTAAAMRVNESAPPVYLSQEMKPADLTMAIQLANEKIASAGLAPNPEQYGQFVLRLYDVLEGGLPNADLLDLRSGKLLDTSTGDSNGRPASEATSESHGTTQPAVQHGRKAGRKS